MTPRRQALSFVLLVWAIAGFDVSFISSLAILVVLASFGCRSTKKNNQPNIANHSKQCIFIAPSIPRCNKMIDINVTCRVYLGHMSIILLHSTTNEAHVSKCNGPRRLNIKSGTIGPPKKSLVWIIWKRQVQLVNEFSTQHVNIKKKSTSTIRTYRIQGVPGTP